MKIFEYVSYDDIPEENKHGNCFQTAMHTVMEDPFHYTLVHGVVNGQGPIEGVKFCHAWVETEDGLVIDNTQQSGNTVFDKSFYYALGDIKIVRKYDYQDMLEMVDKYETYGPWDKVFDSYM